MLVLPLAQPLECDAEILISHHAAIEEERHPISRISLAVNGIPVDRWTRKAVTDPWERLIALPGEVVRGARELVFGFRLHDAVRPSDVGLGRDDRLLGMALVSLCVRPRAAA